MSEPSPRTFTADFKRFFLRGLVILLPTVLTLWIVVQAYKFVDGQIAEPINRGVRVAMVNAGRVWSPLQRAFDPSEEQNAEWQTAINDGVIGAELEELRLSLRAANIDAWWADRWYLRLIGLVVALIAVYIAGRLLGGFFGRRIYRKLETVITQVPVFKQVYPYVKQVVDFLFSDDRQIKFNRVVAVEYPRKGIWSVGFMTGSTMKTIQQRAGESITVFIPSSPTPFTGYTITVPIEDVIEMPITVEEALRFAVTGGVLVPSHQEIEDEPDPEKRTLPSGLTPSTATNGEDGDATGHESPREVAPPA